MLELYKNYGLIMDISQLKELILQNSKELTEDFKRVFHGRGGLYEPFRHLIVDSAGRTLSAALFFKEENENKLVEMLKELAKETGHDTLVVQRRYEKGSPSEVLIGELQDDMTAVENGMKFKLNLLSNQNSLYFPDMKNGRAFVRENAKGKSVLNLFSYTCAFSVAAKLGGASSVVNVDMSKGALKVGQANHHLNAIDQRGVSFLSYNILKSFSRLIQKGPYDLIIIDPPTSQRGSFEAHKDYIKIVRKLHELASGECTVLAALNSTELDENFLKDIFCEAAPEFKFKERLENPEEFKSADEQRSLKNLVFVNKR